MIVDWLVWAEPLFRNKECLSSERNFSIFMDITGSFTRSQDTTTGHYRVPDERSPYLYKSLLKTHFNINISHAQISHLQASRQNMYSFLISLCLTSPEHPISICYILISDEKYKSRLQSCYFLQPLVIYVLPFISRYSPHYLLRFTPTQNNR